MRTFTAILPLQLDLPSDLALLMTPVCAAEPSAPGEYVGRTEGALVDEGGHVAAFILRLASKLAPKGARTLVPTTALRLQPGPIFHLTWTEDQLRAQPRLDEELQPHNRVDGGPPVESQWLPARPNVVPPAGGLSGTEAAKEGVEGGLVGAALGAIAGFAIGGPIGAASLAMFFAAGGGLAGILSGASQETAADASEMKFDEGAAQDASLHAPLAALEHRLSDPALPASGWIAMHRLSPTTTTHLAA